MWRSYIIRSIAEASEVTRPWRILNISQYSSMGYSVPTPGMTLVETLTSAGTADNASVAAWDKTWALALI